ncbi:MAG: TetR/AcrR family transcriptional regulator [Clostridiales bacterium]|nr:TetR/AcrR family transcriptional regulator [Clostridiales bacterium]
MIKDKNYSTKQRILDVATDLFAQYGFKEVSMRRIAAEVGIKASSLYKHYENKEDILESIFDVFREKLSQTEPSIPEFTSPMEYFTMAYEQFMQVMWEPTILKISKIITNEQTHSKVAREFLIEEMTIKPVQATKYVLDIMQEKGMIDVSDTQVFAEEYCAYIVYLYFEQNILNSAPNIDFIDKKMKQHNEFIVRCIQKEG